MELSLFPQGALSSSVITTVWVGVAVIAFLNLRFGTTLSGLVIPGYIVPLLLLRPVSALVIVGEGLVTFLLGVLLAEKLPRWLNYAELFGRDRFFALVLLSVAVRLVFDGLLLPELGHYLTNQGIDFDYRNNLHSFGLIIVALIANQMWNGGMKRGLSSLLIYTGISYFIVRYVLMEFTNFNISSMNYMYEDLASSILASPKAYIILLTSAFIASRLNLQYGWEFNGILIPSLLALQWYQPSKLLVTFVEAFLIYFLAVLLLRIPLLRAMNIEGARQIFLFFNISFVYKIVLGYLVLYFAPQMKVSDFFAFGYLLSTLLAIKMFQKGIALKITRTTLQTSLMAVVSASFIGYGLTLLPAGGHAQTDDAMSANSLDFLKSDESFLSIIGKQRSQLYASTQSHFSGQANPVELDQFNQGLLAIQEYIQTSEPEALITIQRIFEPLNMALTLTEDYLLLSDNTPERGWGIYSWRLTPDKPLSIQVPAPLDEFQTVDVAIQLFLHTGASSLAIAGTKRKQASDGSSDALANSQTPFQYFHRLFGLQSTLQVRQYTKQIALEIGEEGQTTTQNASNNVLWIKGSLPEGLNARQLELVLGEVQFRWDHNPMANRQREQSYRGFAELFLNVDGVRKLMSFGGFSQAVNEKVEKDRIDGYLLNLIQQNKGFIARKSTNAYQTPKLYELLYLDQAVITPLLALLKNKPEIGWSEDEASDIARLNQLAQSVNYEVIRYVHEGSGDNYLILQERQMNDSSANNSLRHWGVYIFRVGQASPYIVQVPRPLAEANTLELGAAMFENLKASALFVAGAHPRANEDGSADVLQKSNTLSLFNAAHQVFLRETRDKPALVLQLRALSDERTQKEFDAILSRLTDDTGVDEFLFKPLEAQLKIYGIRYQSAEGSEFTRGFEVSQNAQSAYMPMTKHKEFYTLWVGPEIRKTYRDQQDNQVERLKFLALGIPTYEEDLATWVDLTYRKLSSSKRARLALLVAYLESSNIVLLQQFLDANAELALTRIIDKNTGQAFLVVADQSGLKSIVNLTTFNDSVMRIPSPLSKQVINNYVDSRSRFLRREVD